MAKSISKEWPLATANEITQSLEIGGRPKGGAGELTEGIPSISAEHFDYGGKFKFERLKYIDETFFKSLKKGVLKKGDVLIVKDGATTGKSAFIDEKFPFKDAAVNEHTFILRTNEKFNAKLFFYFTLSPAFNNHILNTKGGSTIGGIKTGFIDDLKIPIPPLEDQKRIVQKLDKLFAHLEKIKERLDEIPELLKQFRQSVLTQAVRGDFYGRVELTKLGNFNLDIITGPFGSALHKSEYVKNGVPVINPSHIKEGRILPDVSVAISSRKANELERWFLKNDDVILGRRGEMGRAAKFDSKSERMICGTGSLILRTSSDMSPTFLTYYLQSPFCVDFLVANSVGTTMINLNQKILKDLPFPNLSYKQQEFSIKKVEALLSKADEIELCYKKLKEQIEQLQPALLAKAFRGELV